MGPRLCILDDQLVRASNHTAKVAHPRYSVCYPFLLTVVAQNFGGRTKRAVVSTGLFIMQATGNIAGECSL